MSFLVVVGLVFLVALTAFIVLKWSNKELEKTGKEYEDALNALEFHPDDRQLREACLTVGMRYYELSSPVSVVSPEDVYRLPFVIPSYEAIVLRKKVEADIQERLEHTFRNAA